MISERPAARHGKRHLAEVRLNALATHGFLALHPAQSKGWVILASSSEHAWVTELGMSLLQQRQ